MGVNKIGIARFLWPLLLLATAGSTTARDRIALIEFFGYEGLRVREIRRALPVREGDPYSDAVIPRVRSAVKRLTGRDATDVTGICCDEQGDRVLFIGLPGRSSREFRLNPRPTGSVHLSMEIVELYARLTKADHDAVLKGGDAAIEDGSEGYRLLKDPPAHNLELQMRRYALGHGAELKSVLDNSSNARHRAISADALGYARRSPEQTAALIRACRDPDETVRQNATRALGELLSADAMLAKQIPAGVFLDMIQSGIWSDRNKASFVLGELARSKDRRLLAQIESRAWEPLLEMARWRDTGHAGPARVVLGRIRGIGEDRLLQVAFGPPRTFLDALGVN